jgi:hypothetical protein
MELTEISEISFEERNNRDVRSFIDNIVLCLFAPVRFSAYTFGIRIEPHPSPQPCPPCFILGRDSLTSTFFENGTLPLKQSQVPVALYAAHTRP